MVASRYKPSSSVLTSNTQISPCTSVFLFPQSWAFVTTLPLFCFAYLCHQNTFPICAWSSDVAGGSGLLRSVLCPLGHTRAFPTLPYMRFEPVRTGLDGRMFLPCFVRARVVRVLLVLLRLLCPPRCCAVVCACVRPRATRCVASEDECGGALVDGRLFRGVPRGRTVRVPHLPRRDAGMT